MEINAPRARLGLGATPPRAAAGALVALLLLAANLPVALRYGGPAGAAAYVAAAAGAMALAARGGRAAERLALGALLASLAAQVALLHLVAPAYDARMDRDDALTLWWQRLAAGANPYAAPTSMGNPISILPALHLLALPFVLLGNVGYLPICAVAALGWLLWRRYAGDPPLRALALAALAGAPLALFEAAGRSELAANMLLFVGVALWAERWAGRPAPAALPWLGLAIGAVAATRFALWPALGVVGLFVLLRAGPRGAAALLAAAAAAFAALVLPFVLWDPATFFGYAPFGVNATKLGANPGPRALWAAASLVVTAGACLAAHRSGRPLAAAAAALLTVTAATWATFGLDVAYGQFFFIPLLFCLPRRAHGDQAR